MNTLQKQIDNHVNADNAAIKKEFTMAKKCKSQPINVSKHFIPSSFNNGCLSVARCELNNLADCTSKGLDIGVSHIGGSTRASTVTIHKIAPDNSYAVTVLNKNVFWGDETAISQFRQILIDARKVICDHNKLIKKVEPQKLIA